MLQSIMVPLDGSALAEHALPAAVSLARGTGAALHLVRVHDPLAASADVHHFADVDDAVRVEEKRYIQHAVGRVGAAGVAARGGVIEGSPAPALHRYAVERGVDLIVMATHGRTGVSRAWLGSVADAVMRRSSVPVLMVRPGDDAVDLRRGRTFSGILVPLDGSPHAETVLEPALALAETLGATVTLLEVVPPVYAVPQPLGYSWTATPADQERMETRTEMAEDYLRSVAERLRAAHGNVEVRTEVRVFDHTASGILERAHSLDFDLVAMTTQGRGASRVLMGSIADKVLRGTALPLLMLRPPVAAAEGEVLTPEVAEHYGGVAGRRI